jgi:hypothetical protein
MIKSFQYCGLETFAYLTNIGQAVTLGYFALRTLKEVQDLHYLLSYAFSLQFTCTVMYWTAVFPFEGIGSDPVQNILTHGGSFAMLILDVMSTSRPLQMCLKPTCVVAVVYSAFLYYFTLHVRVIYDVVTFTDSASWFFVIVPNFVNLAGTYAGRLLQTTKDKSA